jgi:hypothetical protein
MIERLSKYTETIKIELFDLVIETLRTLKSYSLEDDDSSMVIENDKKLSKIENLIERISKIK